MHRKLVVATAAFMVCPVFAADLLIANARIIDGTGRAIENGSLLIEGEGILAITEGSVDPQDARVIDAGGMTVVPGFIDAHRHIFDFSLTSEQQLRDWVEAELPDKLMELLSAGITTTMSNADPFPYILQVRQRIRDGDLPGPRLLAVGPALTAPDGHPAGTFFRDNAFIRSSASIELSEAGQARLAVRELADAGVDAIKIVYSRWPEAPMMTDAVLAAIVDEADAAGLLTIAHTATVDEFLAPAASGIRRFVHTPHGGTIAGTGLAQILVDAEIPVATTVAPWSPPVFAARGEAYPEWRRTRHDGRLENVRLLSNAGVTLAFGTDSPEVLRPSSLLTEATLLNRVLSSTEVLTSMTRNAAAYLGLSHEIGTLEPGKLADIVILDGDPILDIANLGNVQLVVKAGRIVVDNR